MERAIQDEIRPALEGTTLSFCLCTLGTVFISIVNSNTVLMYRQVRSGVGEVVRVMDS